MWQYFSHIEWSRNKTDRDRSVWPVRVEEWLMNSVEIPTSVSGRFSFHLPLLDNTNYIEGIYDNSRRSQISVH